MIMLSRRASRIESGEYCFTCTTVGFEVEAAFVRADLGERVGTAA